MSDEVAGRLLDAQVEWVIGEFSGKRLEKVIARDVDDALSIAEDLRLADVLDAEQAKGTLRRLVELAGSGPLVEDLVAALADALYDLGAGEQHLLGEVVARESVEALIDKVLSMPTLHDQAMQRMAQSPLVSTVAAKFVSSIINDFVAQNRQLAEKVPGARSLFSLGASAANRVRNVGIVADTAERGTQMAIRRTNSAMREVIKDTPLKEAALELWDLHADEPISELRGYMTRDDLRELAGLVHEIVSAARTTDYVGAALDECVDVFFASYGERSVASLLPELGISRDDLVQELLLLVPPIVAAAKADGRLAQLVRDRLAPFYASQQVAAILAGEAPTPKPAARKAPVKKAPARKKP